MRCKGLYGEGQKIMLLQRKYNYQDSEVLYHYCSAETFMAISATKCLRFSDLFSMNDFMEVHWGYQIWERAANDLLPTIGQQFLDEVDEIIHVASGRALTLAACLSKKGDVLSQWRSYANDGCGFAIGFKANVIGQLPVTSLSIEYDQVAQVDEVKRFIEQLYKDETEAKNQRGQRFVEECSHLAVALASFKNPAFVEEDEVRLIHLVGFRESNSSFRVVDLGGIAFGKQSPPKNIEFHLVRNTPVPHLDISLDAGDGSSPIAEIVIGPKNDSLPSAVSIYLETIDMPNVKVKKSLASYR